MDDKFIQNLEALIDWLAARRPAKRVPSRQECRFCDISALDCPERVANTQNDAGTTSNF